MVGNAATSTVAVSRGWLSRIWSGERIVLGRELSRGERGAEGLDGAA